MVYLLLAEGFEEIEALTPLDILRRAGVEIKTVAMAVNPVVGAHGISVVADLTAAEVADTPAMLILPGGMPGTANLDVHPRTDRLIADTLAAGGHIGAICAAPMLLGRRGLLAGRQAVCFPGFEKWLTGATLLDTRTVTDGPFTTAVGMGAAVEFSLALLTVLQGADAARAMGRAILAPETWLP